MTTAQLQSYMEAWGERDVDRLMRLMTPDCAYHASAGPDLHGRTHVGQDAVRAAIESFFEAFPTCAWEDVDLFVAGDRGFSEWTFHGVNASGESVRFRGCDLFEFRDGLVSVKNAFRKAH